jgi:hypothetical protein
MARAKEYYKHIGGSIYKGKYATEQEIEEIHKMLQEEKGGEKEITLLLELLIHS